MDDDARLSRIETLWSVVQRAHRAEDAEARAAQQKLIKQYGGAVRRYLLGALRDADAADELFQEFALRFVRGDFQSADPSRGRFRNFLKTAIYHLIVDYQRRIQRDRRQKPLAVDAVAEPAAAPESLDDQFTSSWRSELLALAWGALKEREQETGKPYYRVLRYRADHPEMRSPQLAEGLSRQLDKTVDAGHARVLVHRAREIFAELLLAAVSNSLESPTRDELEDELIAVDLLAYCRPALTKRRQAGKL